MRIEITDRAAWLERVNAAIKRIEARRKENDEAYVEHWRKSFLGRLEIRFGATKPEADLFGSYPSIYAWGTLATLKSMKRALESVDTGAVWFSEIELEAV